MELDAIVVGAGQAGLAVASFLKEDGRDFLVLEQGRVGETWRSQRWDSFRLNTPNWMNALPGQGLGDRPGDGFSTHHDLVRGYERYVASRALPVTTEVAVTAVEHAGAKAGFLVSGRSVGEMASWRARTVIVATGIQRVPKVPPVGRDLPPGVVQLHSSEYRAADRLPPGAVVVVGCAQSGCQVAEDLLAAGRTVYLCASKVARAPRRYRGRDITEWWAEIGFFDQTVADLPDPAMRFAAQPQVSGVGPLGHTVSLQQLARDGVRLLGRVVGLGGGRLALDHRLGEYVRFADQRSETFKRDIDAAIVRSGGSLPPDEPDPADAPAPELYDATGPEHLDLRAAGVGAIVWCTGVTGDFGWLPQSTLDDRGLPLHRAGESGVPGLYLVGLPWLRRRKSGILFGMAEDAERVAERLGRHLAA